MLHGLAPLAGIVLVAGAAAAGLVLADPPPAGPTLGGFDHAAHLERGAECADCHLGVAEGEERARAGAPSVSVCLELCHGDFEEEERTHMQQTPNGRFVLAKMLAGEEILWPLANWLPDHVVFSHKRHVAIAGLSCDTCHGDMSKARVLPTEPLECVSSMKECIRCHEAQEATTDCFACHR